MSNEQINEHCFRLGIAFEKLMEVNIKLLKMCAYTNQTEVLKFMKQMIDEIEESKSILQETLKELHDFD